jgi:hypothetical protein
MAAAMQDHIHLDTDNPPTATYPALHETLDGTPMVAMVTERSLTGKLQVHRLLDGADPVQFVNDRMRLRLSLAEMLVVKGLAGKDVYYIPHYHDEAAPAAYVVQAVLVLRPGAITNLDPSAAHWFATVEILDNEAI